ncbi:MAG: ABC transporter substrate-binding protein [Acidobacteriota bacterium]
MKNEVFRPPRRTALLGACCLATLFAASAVAEESAPRVISLDYCADQYVLGMVPRSRILGLSPDAEKPFSYFRDRARGLPKVRPRAEDVLLAQPDLIVRSYGGGPNAAAFFQRAGLEVIQVPFSNDLGAVRESALFMARSLGVPERGEELVRDLDARLEEIAARARPSRSALYMTPSGATTGPGTLVHEMLVAAGLENFEELPGWRSISLERLAYEQPDMVAAAFFDSNTTALWSPMRHPVARSQTVHRPTVHLEGAWTACGAWFLIDAIEAMTAERAESVDLEP